MGRRIAFVMNAATDDTVGKLKYGMHDAARMFKLLVDPRYGACDRDQSHVIYDCESYAQFSEAFFGQCLKSWQNRDQLVFYFSGHGIYSSKYFLRFGRNEHDAMTFELIKDQLRKYCVARYILILDACYSGNAAKASSGSVLDTELGDLPRGGVIMCSCDHKQHSKEYDRADLSLFTYLLMNVIKNGLPDMPDIEWLTVESALKAVDVALESDDYCSYQQRPKLGSSEADPEIWIAKNVHFQGDKSTTDDIIDINIGWQMPMLKFPIPAEKLETLAVLLEETRLLVAAKLDEITPGGFLAENVRANMFLPDHSEAASGYAYKLFIHSRLRSNMDRDEECSIRFAPNQGATGCAFAEKAPVITFRQSNLDGEWEDRFQLTEVHRKVIHPELKWILSLPIIDQVTGEPLATLNVDGLQNVHGHDLLELVSAYISQQVNAFGIVLSDCPKIQVMLSWSE